MSGFSALFYPFATKRQIAGLKMAALYFDEVYVLSPISVIEQDEFKEHYADLPTRLVDEFGEDLDMRVASPEILIDESVGMAVQFQHDAKPLIKEGVVKIVNPFDELKSLSLAREFKQIIATRALQTRNLLEEEEYEYRPAGGGMCAAASVVSRQHHRNRLSVKGLLTARSDAIKAVMYDSALLLAKRLGTVPVTALPEDDHSFARHILPPDPKSPYEMLILEEFRRRGLEPKPEEILARLRQHLSGEIPLAREHTAFKIARSAITDCAPAFEEASISDIIRLRNHCSNELDAFRIEMRRFATKISEEASSCDQVRAISDLVSRDVTPIVAELQRKIKLANQQWAKDLLDKMTSLQTLATLASTVFVGLPISEALLVATGLAGLQAGVGGYLKKSEIKAGSGLSFLLNLKRLKPARRT